jgi:UDP-glucose 4-epimerase
VDELARRGCKHILVIDDFSSGTIDNLTERGTEFVEVRELPVDSPYAAGTIQSFQPEAIYHLAAHTDVQTSFADPEGDAETNIFGTLNVIKAAKRLRVPVVFASTGGAMYGDCDYPASEREKPEPRSPYAVSKLAAEGYLRTLMPHAHTILRYANVYGERQLPTLEGGVVAVFTERLAVGESVTIFGDGRQTRDFVHVDDVAVATVWAWQARGTFNVGTSVETSISDLLDMVRTALNLDEDGFTVRHEPARSGEVRRSVLDSTRLFQASRGDWQPHDLKDGLHRYVSRGRFVA